MFAPVMQASKIQKSFLDAELKKVEQDAATVKKKLDDTDPNDVAFTSEMHQFSQAAQHTITTLREQLGKFNGQFEQCVKLFGEKPGKQQPETFFETLASFITEYRNGKNTVCVCVF